MSDLIELDPQDTRNAMREEIRKTSDHNRARRVVISRVMVGLCSVAIIIAAVPLVMLMYQLIKQGAGQVDWKFFTTLPTTPSLGSIPLATGGISNAIVGTLALTHLRLDHGDTDGHHRRYLPRRDAVQTRDDLARHRSDHGRRSVDSDGSVRLFLHRARPDRGLLGDCRMPSPSPS